MHLRTVDLARATSISSQAVRDYENKGLLPPVERHPNGFRRYTDRHLAALQAVRSLILAGYSSASITKIMQSAHSGDLHSALPAIDAHHATLYEQRVQLDQSFAELARVKFEDSGTPTGDVIRTWRIAETSRRVGLPASTLRFWEEIGLLHPTRDASSGYRVYYQEHVRRLELIVLLRRIGFSFDDIREVIEEVPEMQSDAILRALEARRSEILESSRKCVSATVAVWYYVQMRD